VAVAASAIISRARNLLADTGTTQRWSDSELLGYLSDGQRTLVAAVPSISQQTSTVSLVSGSRQSIPATGHQLITVYRNRTAGGTSGGPVIPVPREMMDSQYEAWYSATPASAVRMFVFDAMDPTAFYVYPPNDGNGSVELNYSVMPADLTATTDNIVVRPIFQSALLDYLLARAHMKDSDYAAGLQLANNYMSLFTAFISAYQQSLNGAK
jgi:hypothetical protein